MIRPLLSLKRLFFDETGSKVRYQYSRHGSQEDYFWEPLGLFSADSREDSILILMVWRFRGICVAFWVVDLPVLGVIILFQDVSGWKSLKMMRDLWQGQKRISFYDDVMQELSY